MKFTRNLPETRLYYEHVCKFVVTLISSRDVILNICMPKTDIDILDIFGEIFDIQII